MSFKPFATAAALLVSFVSASPLLASELTPGQLDAAGRVFTGEAKCEFNQTVSLTPVAGKAGHFTLGHGKARYTMVPEETTTGAVRLVDSKAGMIWLQIPAKSMLMNSKIGQRVIDGCQHAEQRMAVAAVKP